MGSNSSLHILIIILLLVYGNAVRAQEKRQRLYHAWIHQDSQTKSKGILYHIGDSSLVLTSSFETQSINASQHHQVLYVNEISRIKLRRKGKIKRGLLTGFLCGGLPGAAIGFNVNKNIADATHHGAKDALIGSLFGGAIGMAVGGLIGIAKLKIPINGSQGWFDANREKLWRRSYKYYPEMTDDR